MAIFTVGANRYEVEIVTLGNPIPPDYIPPVGVHPVVQMRGQPVSFLADLAFDEGTIGTLPSAFDIPYTIRINLSIPQGNGS